MRLAHEKRPYSSDVSPRISSRPIMNVMNWLLVATPIGSMGSITTSIRNHSCPSFNHVLHEMVIHSHLAVCFHYFLMLPAVGLKGEIRCKMDLGYI